MPMLRPVGNRIGRIEHWACQLARFFAEKSKGGKMEKLLYVSELHMDLNEYIRMSMKVTEKNRRQIVMIAEAIWIVIGVITFLMKQYYLTALMAIVIVAYPSVIVYLYKAKLKKVYAAMPTHQQEQDIRYEFYPNYVRVMTNRNEGKIRYSDVKYFIETADELVLMVEKDKGMLLLKKNCKPELVDFLREKLQH